MRYYIFTFACFVFFVSYVQSAYADLPKSVPVKFYVITQNGEAATDPSRLPAEVTFLNLWYQGRMNFQFAGATLLTKDTHGYCGESFNPELYYNTLDADNALYELADCFGDKSAINVFISKTLTQSTGKSLNGIAMIDQPLHSFYAPGVIIAANLFSYGGVTLTHEVGHVLGLQHTATYYYQTSNVQLPSEVIWHSYYGCGLTLQYPHFEMRSPWRIETNPLHILWPGRENPMGYMNLMLFFTPSFYKGGYAPVFSKIMDCWTQQSFSQAPPTPTNRVRTRPAHVSDAAGSIGE